MPTSPNLDLDHLDANLAAPEIALNTSLDLLDQAVAGILVHDIASDADYTLSLVTDPQEWQYGTVKVTDTGVLLTTTRNIIVPTNKKQYIFINATAQSLVLKTSAGTGITVSASSQSLVLCDGTNVVDATSAVGGAMSDLIDDTTPQLGGDLDTNGHQVQWSKGADVASGAALPVLTDGNYFDVTGTTSVTSIDATAVGTVIKLHFDGVVTLTHHATDLILPNSANYTTAAGDEFEFTEYAAGDYRCTGYVLASGKAIVDISGSGAVLDMPVITKSAAYTIVVGDKGNLIDCDATSAGFTITLLAAATAGDGYTIAVKKTDSTGNTVTIDGDGAETIDGATTQALSTQYDTFILACDGTSWHVLAEPASGGGGDTLPIVDTTAVVKGSVDATKLVKIEADGLTTATTRTMTMPDADITLVGGETNQTFTAAQRGSITALTDAASIASDFDDNNFFSVTLAGNRTLANPSNLVAGQSGSVFITQDGTGSRTLAYGSNWDFAGGVAPVLSTAASSVDRLDYIVRTTGSIHAQLSKGWA